ncbi:bacterio-opsin activator domain-containing protein [Halostella litorea]|uniref:bacterio-opsin activator domain-containing protein n=1 Tax=Halostella litorea TaxID=2528831 RepID=UPI00109290F9|nr:bacterio-opsin activator domain-containing protein [Halostella litorea]
MDDRFERAPVGMVEVDPDGTVRAVNDAAADLLAVDGAGAAGEPIGAVFPDSVEAAVPRAFDAPPEAETAVEEYYPELETWLAVTIVPLGDRVALYLRDVTDRYRTERRLAERDADLERVTIINRLIADVLAELVEASDREAIAETICERLGETDIYEFAWVGERELGSDDVVVRASAGETGRTLDRVEASLDRGDDVPERRAMESGEPTVVQPVGADESVPEPVRRAAFADGLQSLLAIPLSYGASVYGVVAVYTTDRDAFSERERESFGTLGEMAGFAVNAARNRNLLRADTVVELTLSVTGGDDPLVAAAGDAELSVDGVVPGTEGVRCYLAVRDAGPRAVADAVADRSDVRSARVIDERGDAGRLELALPAETLLGRLASLGVTVESATFADGEGEVAVELPPDEDVRRIAETVTRTHDATVTAKREREREVATAREFRDALSERLTDRQENALRTAYYADYFESPRGSSAAEVAEALDITAPTLLHHLRAGQAKLLGEFLAGERE